MSVQTSEGDHRWKQVDDLKHDFILMASWIASEDYDCLEHLTAD